MGNVFLLLQCLLFHPFVVLFFTTHHANAINPSIPKDALSLLNFKHFVSSDPSNLLSGWTYGSSSTFCRWHGVTCGGRGNSRVISLNVTGLHGGELASSIGELSELRVLSIPGNMLSGEIPKSLMNLRELEVLELQGNNFSGNVSLQMSYFESLIVVNLSGNAFSGPIPNGLIFSRNVKFVDLSDNQFSGSIPVMNDSVYCDSLKHLKLSDNFLTGVIPPQIGKCRNLRTLLVDGNILEGKIPLEIGLAVELRVLDVSRNSLTGRIPKLLGNCLKLSVLVLTDLFDDHGGGSDEGSLLEDKFRGEFNAFVGNIPHAVLSLSSLRILWAPRANLGGRLPAGWTDSCSLRILNLAENYVTGVVPESLGMCRNLTFLDLSSNNLVGYLPLHQLHVSCMMYFNVSRNNISGLLPDFRKETCRSSNAFAALESAFLELEGLTDKYFNVRVLRFQENAFVGLDFEETTVVSHDFSWNSFVGSLPLFFVGDNLFTANRNVSYMLSLNNNKFNGTLPYQLVSNCNDLKTLSVNLSVNKLYGEISQALFLNCTQLMDFLAAYNQIDGSIGPGIGDFALLRRLDLRENKLSGALPYQLGNLQNMKWMLLGGNNLTGEIPYQLGRLTSLVVLNLSHNSLIGTIPETLSNATNLEIMLLDHNNLSGEIPLYVAALSNLVKLDVSFNNLSGHIPHLQHPSDCDSYKGNKYLHSCPDPYFDSPAPFPVPIADNNSDSDRRRRKKVRTVFIVVVASASAALCTLLVIVLVICYKRRKITRLSSIRRREVVTFQVVPIELSYDSVVRAAGNFSIRYLIGAGGFGSTYKAELSPGFFVAVKRLSIGKFQGMQQFETEIRTLGRIRHKNLVTLIGYYVGKSEMLLIYNYLSGGNLEAFIHDRSAKNVQWPVIYKIAKGIAEALAYLHYSCVPRIVHRDIKPSNILLDENLNAYLSDFGLARLLEVSETHATTDVAGTFGYVAPEYATTCRVSDKADVYSYGVVLLELISGRRSLDPSFSNYGNGFNIVPWAELLMTEDRCSELFSSALWESGPKEKLLELLKIALTCTEETLSIRPSMKDVLEKLKQLKS